MRPKTRDLLLLFGTPALVGAVLVVLLFGAVKAFGATTETKVLTDAPCVYAAGVLDCRATVPIPPEPPKPPVSCAGFSRVVNATWSWAAGNMVLDTVLMGGISPDGILVVAFKPTSPADVDNLQKIAVTEYPGTSVVTQRTLSISTQPCDLIGLLPGPATSTSPQLQYGVGTVTNSAFTGKPRGVAVTPGVQYYINVANRAGVSATSPSGQRSCFPSAGQSCDIRASLFKPAGH